MAEINSNAGNHRQKGGVSRCKKLSTKVDLTPMVDLGFLLITFFVFTTSMTTPKVVKLFLPADDVKDPMKTANSTVLTIIPLSGNKLFYYHGQLDEAIQQKSYGITTYAFNGGIGDIIRAKQAALDKSIRFTRKDLMLIIKPTEESTYQNITEALDEVLINVLPHYALVDISPGEKAALAVLHIH
jgi:hypothetical protein